MAHWQSFREAVTAMKETLGKLQRDMAAADAAGNSRAALEILGRMLHLQRTFFEEWRTVPKPAASLEIDEAAAREDAPDGRSTHDLPHRSDP
jgi:hypothetical protein